MQKLFGPKLLIWILKQLGFKVSYRQLQYWDKTNFLKPSYHHSPHQPTLLKKKDGKEWKIEYRDYTIDDLRLLLVFLVLHQHTFSVQRGRVLIPWLKTQFLKLNFSLDEVVLLAEGNLNLSIHHGPDRTFRFEKNYPKPLNHRTMIDLRGFTNRVDKILNPQNYPEDSARVQTPAPVVSLFQVA